MPVIFPSVDWFEELKRRFNSAGRENQVGVGTVSYTHLTLPTKA